MKNKPQAPATCAGDIIGGHMKYYLKSCQRAAIKALKTGNDKDIKAIDSHNTSVLAELYNKLLTGEIATFYQKTKNHLIIAHKSTRPGVLIQVSHNWIIDGKVIPCSHANINSFSDLLKEQPFYYGEYLKEFIA